MAKLKSFPVLKAFILWVLVRDPDLRPKIIDLKIKFAAVRQELSNGPAQVDDNVNAASGRFEGGLWAISRGAGTPLATRWPVSPTAPPPISLSAFFPTPTPSVPKSIALEDRLACTVRGWRLSPGKMAPTFISSSRLDTVFFSDVVALLSTPLYDSNIVAAIICTRGLNGIGGELLGYNTADRLTKQAEIESNMITRFRQIASLAGIETHLASLPCVTACGGGVQTQFSSAMNSAMHFAQRALFSTGTGPMVNVVADEAGRFKRGRVLLVSMPDDATAALAVAASLHVCAYDGGIRAATVALSPAATLEANLATLHPTDVARLSAWEARSRADAALLHGKPWIRCPTGCWSVALKTPLSVSPHPTKYNPHPCSGNCEEGCPGLHLGVDDACAAIRESLSSHTAHRGDGTNTGKLWWAYTTAEMLEPGVLCAVALAEEDGITANVNVNVGEGGSAIGGLVRSVEASRPIGDLDGSWQLFVCGSCRCVTHAVAKGECGATRRVAVIVNPSSSKSLVFASEST